MRMSVSQVVGVKDERLGEQVCACIRLKKGQTSSAEEIRAYCKGQVSVHVKWQKIPVLTNKAHLNSLWTLFCSVGSFLRFLTSRFHTMCSLSTATH